MTTTAQPMTLDVVRRGVVARRRAEVTEILAITEWLDQHLVDPRTSADVAVRDYGDGELHLAGDGAPAVSEAAVVELVTTLGRSDSAGRRHVGQALETKYRLPRLWRRLLDGEVEVWRAFRIAESTRSLPLDAATFVDTAVAPFAHSMSWSQLDRTVEAARAIYDPEEVERRRNADPRRFDVRLDQTGVDGYVPVDGLLDLADARDLEAAVAARAAQLAEVCDEPLEVRRAMALGEICRGELALAPGTPTGRGVTLYVHLDETDVAEVDGTPVLVDQVATWCAGANVTVKPVIDLNQVVTSSGYTPSESVAERVRLVWPQCVFPFCTRRARTDLDHRVAHPDGETSTANLAPLCRTHHRMKTHSGWDYEPAATTRHGVPTAFTWTSPLRARFRVDGFGTELVAPEP